MIRIMTQRQLDRMLKEEYNRGISIFAYVCGIKRGTIINPDKVLEEIQKEKA